MQRCEKSSVLGTIQLVSYVKKRITQSITNIDSATSTTVGKNTRTRLEYIIHQNDGNVEQQNLHYILGAMIL